MSQFIIKFDYNVELIHQMIKEVDSIDTTNIDLVREYHKKFVKVRTTIKKQEKEMVDEANKFRNDVFSKRDEYLSLSEPIEEKLKTILEEDEKKKIIEARKSLLPMKKQQLSLLDISPVADEFILSLDEEQWVNLYQEKTVEHNNNVARKEQEKKAEQDRIEREDRIKKEAQEKAEKEKSELAERMKREKEEALSKAEQDKKEAIARMEREAIENELKAKREIEETNRKAKEAQEKLEADKKYQKFLRDNQFNGATDIINSSGSETKLYRLVAIFNK